MDRNTLLRWVIIASVVLAVYHFLIKPKMDGSGASGQPIPEEKYVNAPGFPPDVLDVPAPGETLPATPPEGEICKIQGQRFVAELSSRGAGVKNFFLQDRYANTESANLSTTPDHERWRNLRTLFRGENANDQVRFDRFPWRLEADPSGKSCRFTYVDENLVQIQKTFTASARPFELEVETKIKNLAADPKKHRFSIETFAFRRNKEIAGHLGSVSPFVTELACATSKEVVRHGKDDFKEGWLTVPGTDRFAAVSDYYFGKAIVPIDAAPDCQILAEDWFAAGQSRDADEAGAVYHARLNYPARDLAPGAEATYRQTAFFGPKERQVLAQAGGPGKGLGDLINLGFFSPVAKVLVSVLQWFHDHAFNNWGLAIILMTICLRVLLFPLSIKQIKTSFAMRRLKPEVDALNAKFADDPQAKNMAMMELWRKHNVNPLGGCLPQLAQMPVWFAMYTTLQTAVEMYHTKFWWFKDLSVADPYFILPVILGALMVVQQKLVPQQGMDPMQQKMMLYLLPGVFMVMMLFLPAALGVYMMTNSVLGIAQQLIVERFAPKVGPTPPGTIGVKQVGKSSAGSKAPPALGKGKASV